MLNQISWCLPFAEAAWNVVCSELKSHVVSPLSTVQSLWHVNFLQILRVFFLYIIQVWLFNCINQLHNVFFIEIHTICRNNWLKWLATKSVLYRKLKTTNVVFCELLNCSLFLEPLSIIHKRFKHWLSFIHIQKFTKHNVTGSTRKVFWFSLGNPEVHIFECSDLNCCRSGSIYAHRKVCGQTVVNTE